MDYDSLLQKIIEDPDALATETEESLRAIRKQVSPYGQVVTNTKRYANISVINWREQYMREFITTGMVGYLYRRCAEWGLSEDDAGFDSKAKGAAGFDSKAKGAAGFDSPVTEGVCELAKEGMRNTVRTFLDTVFEYNPDRHIWPAAHKKGDAETPTPDKESALRALIANEVIKGAEDEQCLREEALASIKAAIGALDVALRTLPADSKAAATVRKQRDELVAKWGAKATQSAAAATISAYSAAPSGDMFHMFDRYVTNHYEDLRKIHDTIYLTKPDLEFAVMFHGEYETEEEAQEYVKKHQSAMIADVLTISTEGWYLLGPFRENRDRISFYNRQTEIVKQMLDFAKQQHEAGKDMMEKRVKRGKKKEIEEMGLDAAGLKEYRKAVNTIAALGAKEVLTDKERTALHDSIKIKEQAEVPDEAVQVNTFYTDAGGKFRRSKWYTKQENADVKQAVTR